MHIPLFNYTPPLFHKVKDAGILFSEDSILKLHCFKDRSLGAAEEEAVENFYYWRAEFVKNCEKVYAQSSPELKAIYRLVFEHELLNCLFVAELFDWRDFNRLETASYSSFFAWQEGRLINTRKLSNLLVVDAYGRK